MALSLEDELIRELQQVDHDQDGVAYSEHVHNQRADVFFKLLNLAGEPALDSLKADEFLGMVCRLLAGGVVTTPEDNGAYYVNVFREYVKDVCRVLRKTTEGGACDTDTDTDTQPRKSGLSIGMVDLMRTAAFCLSTKETDREYTQFLRKGKGSRKGHIWYIARNVLIGREWREAYCTAEAMYVYFGVGIEALEDLASKPEESIIDFIESASENTRCSIECMAIPAMLDGQRLYAGNCVAAKVFGHGEGAYGNAFVAKHALNANSSMISLQRIILTICCFLSMANACELSDVDKCAVEEQIETILTKVCAPLQENESGRVDTPGAIRSTMSIFATWFEEAVHSSTGYVLVRAAFQSNVVVLGDGASADIKTGWNYMCEQHAECENGIKFWDAVKMLCALRQATSKQSLPVHTGLHVALSGIVGNAIFGREINGPFVLNLDTKKQAAAYYNRFPERFRNIVAVPQNEPKSRSATSCGKSRIVGALICNGQVRGQHEKGRLPEARLKVSLTMCALKESLARDINPDICASPSEGRKDLRRVYIIALQTLPAVRTSLDEEQHTYLIEKSRSGNCGTTNADNVEKPWRDVACGGSIISTILFPLASRPFMETIQEMKDDTNTNQCVKDFSEQLLNWSEQVFNTQYVTQGCADQPGIKYVDTVFMQQKAFVKSFCSVINGCGALWEACNLTFSVHANKDWDDDDDDDVDGDDRGDEALPLSSFPSSATASLLTHNTDGDKENEEDEFEDSFIQAERVSIEPPNSP